MSRNVYNYPKSIFFNGIFPVPTVATDYATKDTAIHSIVICNTTAGALTFTCADKQGTPRFLFNAVSVPANGNIVFNPGEFPVLMKGGVTLTASGVGLQASIIAFSVV